MSARLEPRPVALVDDASPSGRLGDISPDTADPEVLDCLAIWLAEVSAEVAMRRASGEAEPLTPTIN